MTRNSARAAVITAAGRNGWRTDVDMEPSLTFTGDGRSVLLFTRGLDSVAVEFTRSGSIKFAGLYPADRVQVDALDGSIRGYATEAVHPRHAGKRETVLGWLETDIDDEQTGPAPSVPTPDADDTAVVVRGDDLYGDGTTCRDCGDPADPSTIGSRPTCPSCLQHGYWNDLFTIVHLHGSDSDKGAAAMAELRAAGQWCDYDETCTCEACRDINFPEGVPVTVTENTDADPADTGAGELPVPAPYVDGDTGAIAHHHYVTLDVRTIRPGAVHVWTRGTNGDPVRVGTYTIDDPDLVAKLARDVSTTDEAVRVAMGRTLDMQSPNVWPVDRDTAVVVHPGNVLWSAGTGWRDSSPANK